MSERRWAMIDEPWPEIKTDADVLAEMDTDILVFEIVKRFELGEHLTSPELYRFLQRVQYVMAKEDRLRLNGM